MNSLGTIDGDAVRFERLLPGPIERVWSYLTDEPLLTTWLAVRGGVPAQPGATFELLMAGGDDLPEREGHSATMYGTVLAYEPPHLLEYTWGVRAPDGTMLNSTLRLELATRGDRVVLTLTHHPVMQGFEMRTLSGWRALLDALQARLDERR